MSGDLVGYARVATPDQDPQLQLQHDALMAAGCARVFTEVASGALRKRPRLAKALEHTCSGDVLVVWRLDRLGYSLPHLVGVVTALERQGVGFRSLTEGLDTTDSDGKVVFHVMEALAGSERTLVRERTMAGLAAARAQGRAGGRRPKMTPAKLATALELHKAGRHTVGEIAEILGVSRSTVHRALARPPVLVAGSGAEG